MAGLESVKRAIRLGLIAVFLTGPTTTLRAETPPEPSQGETRLPSGRLVTYTIHHNRNSLRDDVRVGNGLIALTTSGALMRFELPEVRLVRERTDLGEFTCLGRGQGATILAGLSDGRVCRVDPVTLDLKELARVSGVPTWAGWAPEKGKRPAGLVVVTRHVKVASRRGKEAELSDERGLMRFSVIHDLATGRTFTLGFDTEEILLDRQERLWFGLDNGEWGGLLAKLDLPGAKLSDVPPLPPDDPDFDPCWDGITGFAELRDGQVWAYGAVFNGESEWSHITRIDADRPVLLFESKVEAGNKTPPGPLEVQPGTMIFDILEEDVGLTFYTNDGSFRTDRALQTWTKLDPPKLVYRRSAPIEGEPSINFEAVHLPRREGEHSIVATREIGFVVVAGATATSYRIPGQLEAERLEGVRNSNEGTLFSDVGYKPSRWKLESQGWKGTSLPGPPFKVDLEQEAEKLDSLLGDRQDRRMLEGGRPFDLTAAIAGSDGNLLIATNQGLRTFDPVAHRLGLFNLDAPPSPINTFAVDGLARLWIGGEKGLWMVNEDGKTLESFDAVSWLGRSEVFDIAPDPNHDDGVIVALGTRGVTFVRAKQKP